MSPMVDIIITCNEERVHHTFDREFDRRQVRLHRLWIRPNTPSPARAASPARSPKKRRTLSVAIPVNMRSRHIPSHKRRLMITSFCTSRRSVAFSVRAAAYVVQAAAKREADSRACHTSKPPTFFSFARLRIARTCCHGRGWRRSHACRHRCRPPLGGQAHEREGVLNQSTSEGSRKSGSGSHRGPLDRCPRRPDPDANVAFQVAGMYHSRFGSCIVKG